MADVLKTPTKTKETVNICFIVTLICVVYYWKYRYDFIEIIVNGYCRLDC